LLKDNETLSDLIVRSGGFTKDAFTKGILFKRSNIEVNISKRNLGEILDKTLPSMIDTTGKVINWNLEYSNLNRIIIDVERILKGDNENDIILEDGDSIYVPYVPTGVSVTGTVAFSGTIKFSKGKSLGYYIDRAGGFLKNADKKEIRIVKYNGKVLKVGTGFKDIDPGDVVIVPQSDTQKSDVMKLVMDSVTIISTLLTSIYIITKLK
jgi:protein involved in polysaccharide export with SLBB domain